MVSNSNRIAKIATICIGAVLCCCFAYGWRLASGRTAHSDELSNVFVGLDMLQGNIFLKDWHFSTGLFGIPIMVLSAATLFLGYSDTLIYVIAAINYTLMIAAAAFLVQKYARKRKLEKSYIYVIIAVLILMIPRAESLLNAGTHVLSYAAAIVALYVTWYLSVHPCKLWGKIVWILVLGILTTTNSMFLYTACIPIALTGVIISYEDRKGKKLSPFVMYGILSVILYAVLKKIWVICRGESIGEGIGTVFTSRENVWNNVIIGICNILEVYGVDVWGENVISIYTCRAIVGFVIFVKLVYEIYKFMKSKEKQDRELIYLFMGMAIINICAYVASTVPLYAPDVHLIQPFLIGFSIAGVLAWLHNISIGKSEKDRGGVLALCTILFMLMFPAFTLKQPDNTDRRQVAEYLLANGYEKGFADYWEAASVMYETEGNVTISPVICHNIVEVTEDTSLVAYKWMSKKDWEQQEGNFLIIDSKSEALFGINYDRIISTFGQWSDAIQFGDITLIVWDEDKKLTDYGEN